MARTGPDAAPAPGMRWILLASVAAGVALRGFPVFGASHTVVKLAVLVEAREALRALGYLR